MSKLTSKFLRSAACAVLVNFLTTSAFGQRELAGAAEAKVALDRLNVCGTILMIAAHPDDENTAVLAYFARGRKLDTGYLSLTRGEGGQNLIGPELGERLGVIRTQELLDARRIDGAVQFFSRAIDFGFTKTADETLQKWGRERILSDVVWTIRKFRPDIIILRFSGTPRDGHGQHQTSAILGKEAFAAAADPNRFSEQLNWVEPWQAKRLVWNAFAFTREQQEEAERQGGRVSIDTGEYNPLLGFSYGEIAAMSRSMHRTQGMGSPERRGSRRDYFVPVAGDPAKGDLLDGIDTSWNRIPGGGEPGRLLAQAAREFDPDHPERSAATLLKARPLIAAMKGQYPRRKLRELDEAVALCSGLWVDAAAEHPNVVPGKPLAITVTAINRSPLNVEIERVTWSRADQVDPGEIQDTVKLADNKPWTKDATWRSAASEPYTQPYWLVQPRDGDVYRVASQMLIGMPENAPVLEATFHARVEGTDIELTRPLLYRYVDRVYGERLRPVAVVPPIALSLPQDAVVFPDARPKTIDVSLKGNVAVESGTLRLIAPAGWNVTPERATFSLREPGEQKALSFQVTPPAGSGRAELKAVATTSPKEIGLAIDVIDYPHIRPQTLFPPAASNIAAADIKTLAHRVGYIMGAGDEVPQALRQIGVETELLGEEQIARGDLSRFDAIVTGVRAWNTRPDLRSNVQRLWDYAAAGGTVVVQYNVLEGGFGGGDPKLLDSIGPYPITIGRDRVTVEEAPVQFPNPDLTILQKPNRITERDFEGWIQERGLYFASKWDPRYQSVLESHDPGEKPLEGGTLFAPVGKGAYIFTAYSWFRELPAGVPGAYRVFANFISAGRTLQGDR